METGHDPRLTKWKLNQQKTCHCCDVTPDGQNQHMFHQQTCGNNGNKKNNATSQNDGHKLIIWAPT